MKKLVVGFLKIKICGLLKFIQWNVTAAVRAGSVASARHVRDVNFNWNRDGLFNNLWDGLGNISNFLVLITKLRKLFFHREITAAVWVSGGASASTWVVVWGLSECHLGIWFPDWVGIFVSVRLQLISDSSDWNNSLSNTHQKKRCSDNEIKQNDFNATHYFRKRK